MLAYNEIKPKKIIVLDGEPFQVLSVHVFRKQQRKPVNQTKLRHLITGKVVEHTFHQAETVEEADVEKNSALYLFSKDNRHTGTREYWFSSTDDPSERFMLDKETVGNQNIFLKDRQVVETLVFNEKVVAISLPIKINLLVKDAPPNVRGNTAQGGTKLVVLETGATVTTPMFVETGDTVEVNTETGEYVRRVE